MIKKFGVVNWDWKAKISSKKIKEMWDLGLGVMNTVPDDLIFSDCQAAIFAERVLSDEEIEFLWFEYNNIDGNPNSLLEETDNYNVFELFDTTWEQRHPGE